MATVFRATDERLLREVAVKVLLGEEDQEELLFFFHREARAIVVGVSPARQQVR